MNDEHREILKKSLQDSFKLQEKFSDFQLQTKISLSLSQLSFFQSLGGIGLALLAIGLSVERISFDVWTIISIVFSLLLVVYTSSLSREIIDYQDKVLWDTGVLITSKTKQIQEKILEAFNKNDSSVFFSFAQSELETSKELNTNLGYVGEIVVFLFFNLVYFGALSMMSVCFSGLWFFGIIFTTFLSFKDWSMTVTKLLSFFFGWCKKKF